VWVCRWRCAPGLT